MSDYSKISTTELHKQTRRRLGERPVDMQSWDGLIEELKALAVEIRARIKP